MKKDKPVKRRKKVVDLKKVSIIVVIVMLMLVGTYNAYKTSKPTEGNMTYLDFTEKIDNNEVKEVTVIKNKTDMNIVLNNGEEYKVINPGHDTVKLELLEKGVEVKIADQTYFDAISALILSLPTIIILSLIAMMLVSQMSVGTTRTFNLLKPEEIVKFSDVAGMSESKEEVMFAVQQLRRRGGLKEMGAVPTRGIILEGPPGTGKTMLAKAIAGEADVPFISTSGSDFAEMFVGVGAGRVRALWELAKINAPCVVFIDEIDAVGGKRSSGTGAVDAENNRTLNALLQEMDGIGGNSGVFVVAATNRVQDLDSALTRPGRFDKKLYIGPPKSKEDRNEIVEVHLKNKRIADGVTVDQIGKLVFGMTGAEIAHVLNESVLVSLRNGSEGIIELKHVDESSMKLRASGVVTTHTSEEDRNIVAIHEAGHAVISSLEGKKVAKVSIIPYTSGIGGMTVQDTDDLEGIQFRKKDDILSDIRILMGGRVAEELVYGQVSDGSSNDIERASLLAYSYVNNYGMSSGSLINKDIIGKVHNILIDSNSTLERANDIMLDEEKKVRDTLENNRDELDKLYSELLDKETIIDYSVDIV